jgi:biopolymer transport protein ExbD
MNLRGNKRRLTSHVETSSLNDIMFFLLLFFLITSTVVNPNVIKLLLPSGSTGKAVNKQTITVSVDKDNNFFIDKKPVTKETLELELGRATAALVEPTVVLRIDASLNVQSLVDILEVGNKLKVKMIMATQTPKKG